MKARAPPAWTARGLADLVLVRTTWVLWRTSPACPSVCRLLVARTTREEADGWLLVLPWMARARTSNRSAALWPLDPARAPTWATVPWPLDEPCWLLLLIRLGGERRLEPTRFPVGSEVLSASPVPLDSPRPRRRAWVLLVETAGVVVPLPELPCKVVLPEPDELVPELPWPVQELVCPAVLLELPCWPVQEPAWLLLPEPDELLWDCWTSACTSCSKACSREPRSVPC